MKTAIVTGAGGFIGGAVTKLLLEKGVSVWGIDINEKVLERDKHPKFTPIIASFKDYDHLAKLIPENTDVFYHFAWEGVFGNAFKDYTLQLNNAKYACDALMAAIHTGCKKFVFAGTYNEIEIADFIDMTNQPPRYTCIYSAAKTSAEIICKTIADNSGIEYSAGLTSMSYGENNRSMMLANVVLKQLVNGENPKLIEGNIPYDFIYIDDIARAFYAIGEQGKHLKSYYIGHRKLKLFKEWLNEIGKIVNPAVNLKFGAFPDDASRNYAKIDLDALYNDTGFECISDFKESILKTAKWVKENL